MSRLMAKLFEVWMLLQLRLCQAHGGIVDDDISVNAETHRGSTVAIPGGIFRRERKVFTLNQRQSLYQKPSGTRYAGRQKLPIGVIVA